MFLGVRATRDLQAGPPERYLFYVSDHRTRYRSSGHSHVTVRAHSFVAHRSRPTVTQLSPTTLNHWFGYSIIASTWTLEVEAEYTPLYPGCFKMLVYYVILPEAACANASGQAALHGINHPHPHPQPPPKSATIMSQTEPTLRNRHIISTAKEKDSDICYLITRGRPCLQSILDHFKLKRMGQSVGEVELQAWGRLHAP